MIDWRGVGVGGAEVEGLSNSCHYGRGVLAWGHREGRPWAARLLADWVVAQAEPRWAGRVTGVVQEDTGGLCVTGGSPPRMHPYDDAEPWEAPAGGTAFVAGWTVMGDEDSCNLAVDGDGVLHAYEHGAEEPTAGPRLCSGHGSDDLVVAGAEIGVVVAGPLAAPGVGGSAQLWSYANGAWTEVEVAGPAVAWTDAYTRWEPVLAGHRDGRPLVVSHTGTRLAAPQVGLDPEHPQVCVAHVDGPPYDSADPAWSGRLALVVQAVEGIQLWLQHDHGWTMLPGPAGTLRAARLGYNEKWTGWVATDTGLWFADLSAVWDALA